MKIWIFVFVALVNNVKVTSATITFPDIQETTTPSSFHKEIPKTVFKVIENDLANCCQNEQDLVDYRNWGVDVEVVAAKVGYSTIYRVATNAEAIDVLANGFR